MKNITTNTKKTLDLNGGKAYYCKTHRQHLSSYSKAWWHVATKHVGDWATIWAKLVVEVFT